MADPAVKMTRHGYPLATELFEVRGDDLQVGELSVREIVSQIGSPAYIYDGAVMRRAYRRLAAVLDGFAAIYYSAKANPARSVIRLFIEEGAGVEIASIGEYHAAIAAGAKPERILFAGPGKRHAELAAAIDGGIGEIHIEGHDEIARLRAIGRPVRASHQSGSSRSGGRHAHGRQGDRLRLR
jgi:diaminopimelate decarboxylase